MKLWRIVAQYRSGTIVTWAVYWEDVPKVDQVLDLIEQSKHWKSGHIHTVVKLEEVE